MAFKVTLVKRVRNHQNPAHADIFRVLNADLILPFAPYAGLFLSGRDLSEKLISAHYDLDKARFYCECETEIVDCVTESDLDEILNATLVGKWAVG